MTRYLREIVCSSTFFAQEQESRTKKNDAFGQEEGDNDWVTTLLNKGEYEFPLRKLPYFFDPTALTRRGPKTTLGFFSTSLISRMSIVRLTHPSFPFPSFFEFFEARRLCMPHRSYAPGVGCPSKKSHSVVHSGKGKRTNNIRVKYVKRPIREWKKLPQKLESMGKRNSRYEKKGNSSVRERGMTFF